MNTKPEPANVIPPGPRPKIDVPQLIAQNILDEAFKADSQGDYRLNFTKMKAIIEKWLEQFFPVAAPSAQSPCVCGDGGCIECWPSNFTKEALLEHLATLRWKASAPAKPELPSVMDHKFIAGQCHDHGCHFLFLQHGSQCGHCSVPESAVGMEQVDSPQDLRMHAYYYGFSATGVPAIDLILSAVACAGKAYHHTDSWREECEWVPHTGNSPVEWIQNAANAAAESLRRSGAQEKL